MIIEWIVLLVVYFAAILCFRRTSEIKPWIWGASIVADIVLIILKISRYSWLESLLAMFLTFVLVLIAYSKVAEVVGGGVLKGLCVSAMYFGRYTILLIVFLIALFALAAYIRRNKIAHGLQNGVRYLGASALLTMAIEYLVQLL